MAREENRVAAPKPRVHLPQCAGYRYVDYKNVAFLRKFISDRGKIRANRVTGLSPQDQRIVARSVKNAREMALLPYTSSSR